MTDEDKKAIRDLIDSGGLKLSDTRALFTNKTGYVTSLTDEQLIECHAKQTDDDDDELVELIKTAEAAKETASA